jgi:hypothetical protein
LRKVCGSLYGEVEKGKAKGKVKSKRKAKLEAKGGGGFFSSLLGSKAS